MTGANNFSGDWDDTGSGGQGCARGRHCAEADYQGNAARGPRAFCETDRAHVGSVIRDLPQVYVELHYKLAKGQQPDGQRVSGGGKEAPTPLDLDIEAFLRHVILVAVSWEEAVRVAARLSPLPDGLVRDGTALQRACVLLAGRDRDRCGHLDVLLALAPETVNRPVTGSTRLADLEPGTLIRVDSSGDAWQKRDMDGTAAALEFLTLSSRARAVLGLNLQSRRVAVRCDGCESIGTLKQREALGGGWEAVVRCSACPQVYIGQPFELLMGREYAETVKAGHAP